MPESEKYQIRQWVLAPSVWGTLTAHMKSYHVTLLSNDDLNIRSDAASATSQSPLPAYTQEAITGPILGASRNQSDTRARFEPGDVVLYAQPQGTATVTAYLKCVY